MTTTITRAPQLLTGRYYSEGEEPREVTGFPVFVHRAGDWTSGTSLAIVDLLTEDGVRYSRVLMFAWDLHGVPVKTLHAMSETTLWSIADRDWKGYGVLALAELALRENREAYGRQVAREAELLRSKQSADILMGR